MVSLRCCKTTSAIVPETGEPMATPLSGWYIWPWNEKFCLRMMFRSFMIWWVECWSCLVSWVLVRFRVLWVGMLTKRSLMLNMSL